MPYIWLFLMLMMNISIMIYTEGLQIFCLIECVHWQSGQYCNGVSRHQSICRLATCQLMADFHTQSTNMQLTLSSCSLLADNLINVGSLQHQYITNGSPTDHWDITDTCLTRGVDRRRGPQSLVNCSQFWLFRSLSMSKWCNEVISIFNPL